MGSTFAGPQVEERTRPDGRLAPLPGKLPHNSRDEALGLYLSVPFCQAKCTFCNFASGVYPPTAMPAYIASLTRQLRAARTWAAQQRLHLPERVDTIYLGGGTPSLLRPELLTELFTAIRAEFAVDLNAEITLEAAPLQLEPATLEAALRSGTNRISFGVQSFVDGEARATARTHSGTEALAEIERVRSAGVQHVSADLIAGLPGQTDASWQHSLAALVEAPLDHASVYMFELDEGSRLGAEALRGGVRYGAGLLPHDDAVAEWYGHACERLGRAGLFQYEISNFARETATGNGRSRHNERYWLRAPYLGLGVDAHSMLRNDCGAAARFQVDDELTGFLGGGSWSEPQALTRVEELEECWFLGLRRNAGVSVVRLQRQFGPDAVSAYLPALDELVSAGFLESVSPQTFALTARGRLLSNDVFGALLAVSPEGNLDDDPLDRERGLSCESVSS